MLGKLKLYAIGIIVFVAALFGIYFKGKGAGQQEAENKYIRRRVDALKKAKDVRDEVMDDPHFVDRARNWVRKDDDR